MKRGSKLVGHSTEIIRQSKIKGPLPKLQFFHFILTWSYYKYGAKAISGKNKPKATLVQNAALVGIEVSLG